MGLRILHVAKYFYPALGGIEQVARDTVDALAREQQIVLCFSGARCDSRQSDRHMPKSECTLTESCQFGRESS